MRRRPRLQNPLSSSGQTALYSGRPAGEGIPHAASLPPCTPSRHCDSRPLRVRQSRRFLETGSLFPPLAALRRFPLPHKTRFAGLLWGAPFGCAEKRKRLLMVSREKTLAAAFQTSFETPFPACYGGYWGADSRACVHSTAYAGSEAEGASVCPLLLFCCRTLEVAEDWCRGGSGWPLLLFC